jgi:hypothetical protein
MPFSHLITQILWGIPLVLQAAVLIVMLRRNLARIFPMFFGYTAVVLMTEVALLPFNYRSNIYGFIYWPTETLAILLSLGVIFETLGQIVPASPFRRNLFKIMWIVAAALAIAAVMIFVLTPAGSRLARSFEFVVLLERSVRFLQVCLLIVVIALISKLGLTWHYYPVGILAGFGIYSAGALLVFELRGHLHLVSDDTLALINSSAYNFAAMIWAFYFLRPPPKTPLSLPDTNLPEWSDALSEYANKWYRRS